MINQLYELDPIPWIYWTSICLSWKFEVTLLSSSCNIASTQIEWLLYVWLVDGGGGGHGVFVDKQMRVSYSFPFVRLYHKIITFSSLTDYTLISRYSAACVVWLLLVCFYYTFIIGIGFMVDSNRLDSKVKVKFWLWGQKESKTRNFVYD